MAKMAFPFVHRQVEEVARSRPDAPAVICRGRTMTFGELNARADLLACQLRRLGVGTESVVGLCADRGPELFTGLLAAWKAGGAYVPMDPRNPSERLAFILRDVRACVLLTQERYRTKIPAGGHAEVCLDAATGQAGCEIPALPASATMPDDLAYIIYTSGSTGLPKGVQISHRSLASYLAWFTRECLRGPGGGGAPLFSSVAFDLVVPTLWAPLAAGRPVHVLSPDADPTELGRLLAESGPFDFIKLTPSHLALLTRQLERTPVSGLAQVAIVGGEPLSGRAANRWHELTGSRVINEYGPTENTVAATAFEVMPCAPPGDVPIGHPRPAVTAHVLDERGEPVPAGVTGELYVGGAGVARGYHGRPALTAERFTPDPYGPPGSRRYRTGDLVRARQDGAIDFLGRTDDQIKVHGYRVEPGEIASALARLPVIEAAWAGLRDRGDGATQLVGYVVPAPGMTPTTAQLRAAVAQVLPAYLVPVAFVLLDAMPLTPSGKVDRVALAALTGSQANDGNGDAAAEEEAAGNEVEEAIRRIWQEALYARQVRAHDDFFALGGDSLTAVAVMFRVQQELDVDIPVHALFATPTVAGLARAVAAELTGASHVR